MQYPHDGGVSAIRFFLGDRSHPLARVAASAITVGCCDAGELVCQCGAVDYWSARETARWAILSCACNGSSLPLYIGTPPSLSLTDGRDVPCPSCKTMRYAVAIAVGYPDNVPQLGSLDAERAQEIIVAVRCSTCATERIAWRLQLPEPCRVDPADDWLRSVQGRFR